MKTVTSYLLSKNFLKNFLLEFGPIAVFVFFFYTAGPYMATVVLMISTLISVFFTFFMEKRIPLVALYVTLLTIIFGFITLHKRNIEFIQIRDTIYDATLAFTIVLGFLWKKNVVKLALSPIIELNDVVWKKIAIAWVIFFATAALLNEYIRNMHPVHVWLDYKVIMVFVTTFFGVASLYFFTRNEVKER